MLLLTKIRYLFFLTFLLSSHLSACLDELVAVEKEIIESEKDISQIRLPKVLKERYTSFIDSQKNSFNLALLDSEIKSDKIIQRKANKIVSLIQSEKKHFLLIEKAMLKMKELNNQRKPLGGKALKGHSEEVEALAKEIGFTKTSYKAHGQAVFKNGTTYITLDIDGHKGAVWKKAKSKWKNLLTIQSREGSFDWNLSKRLKD